MGIREKLNELRHDSMDHNERQKSLKHQTSQHLMIPPGQVTEQTLQVWRSLPLQIRRDPSMVSFQLENDRLHGSGVPTDDESNPLNEFESSYDDEHSFEGTEFIRMHNLQKRTKTEQTDDKSSDGEGIHSDNEASTKAKPIVSKVREKKKSQDRRKREKTWKRYSLLVFWIFAALMLMIVDEKHLLEKTLDIPLNKTRNFILPTNPTGDFRLKIFGIFNETHRLYNQSVNRPAGNYLIIQPQISISSIDNETTRFENVLHPWFLSLVDETLFDYAAVVARNFTYKMTDEVLDELKRDVGVQTRLSMRTNVNSHLAIKLIYDPLIINVKTGTMLAALILFIFYGLLVWEVFQRTFIAIICSLFSIAVLAYFNDRPNMHEIIQWMDMEMLTLIFSMMIIIAILTETGVFDYIAVVAFELSHGKTWPMVYTLCAMTCVVSGFLDNMTTVLLMSPVAIRLCEVMSLDPVPVLMGIIVHANIGGSLTPIGDPISIIICSNHFIAAHGVTFMNFTKHTILGVILTVAQSCLHLRFVFRDRASLRLNEPKELKDLTREIMVWQRAGNSISSYSKDAEIVRAAIKKKVKSLKNILRRKQRALNSEDDYVHTLEDLKLKYPIKNKLLLMQACAALAFVIICFFVQSVPHLRTLPLGWVALFGVIVLLIVLNRDDMEHLMHRIEWTTLLFFAAMLVMMECVERLGLFAWIGQITENIILFVDRKHRLAMAIFIILWISALASSILDSVPVTAMMVRVVVSLVAKETLGLPLKPLVWALAFGPSLGGNGTLYGASSNIISAGIAEQHGYKITFTKYLKVGFPMMVGQVTIITAYLMIAHILFEWH